MAVGAALALEGSGRLPVAVLGDGDFLMGGTAVWTAAHYRLPLLIVVANNSFFYNDVVHAGTHRGAAPAAGPELLDRPGHYRPRSGSGGVRPFARLPGRWPGPRPAALPAALAAAVAGGRSGQCVLVDVRVRPDGYATLGG